MGNAVLVACRDVQAKLGAMAAKLEGIEEERAVVDRGEVRIGDRTWPVREVLGRALGRSVVRSSASARCARRPSPTTRSAGRPRSSSSNCTAVEVEVDRRDRRRDRDAARDGVGRREGAPREPGPRPGRGRRRSWVSATR
jgi:CO/xanthine dehydrogenase Mo-binding subunit